MYSLKYVYVNDINEINSILEFCEQNTTIKLYNTKLEDMRSDTSVSLNTQTRIFYTPLSLTLYILTRYYNHKYNKQARIYAFRLDGAEIPQLTNGGEAYRLLQQSGAINGNKIVDITESKEYEEARKAICWNSAGEKAFSASPLLGYAPEHDKEENYVWVYDLNSAYGAVLSDKVPDTSRPEYDRVVGENEIGFMFTPNLPLVHKGHYAQIVFPLIESPFKDFVRKYYHMKSHPENYTWYTRFKTAREVKIYAKQILNFSIGAAQNHNPFFRAYIVNKCTEFIEQYLDEDSILWNTDSIFSLRERPDLPLSEKDLGCFKLEYQGPLKHIGLNYQSPNNEKLAFRGVSRKLIMEYNYDIFSSETPSEFLKAPYYYNSATMRVEENNV